MASLAMTGRNPSGGNRMTRRLPDLEAWAIFARVAELGSFARAAEDLGLANPTVSKAIARLEARLGVALISRTSRRLSLTEGGRAALARASALLREGEAVEDEALQQSAQPRGRVRIAAPLSFGVGHMAATLPGFLAAYPEVQLDFALSDRRVDLIAEGFDLALRIARLEDSSLRARKLCAVRLLLVAAPGYFAARQRPTHPAELASCDGLLYTGGETPGVWRFAHPQFGEETVAPRPRLWSDNAEVVKPALLAGQGLAIQPEFLVWRELRAGALEPVMPDWAPPPLALHLLTPPSSMRPARVQAVIDHLTKTLAQAPWAALPAQASLP
jgi:DNA-binding transcriptional LysR family regulator